MSILDDLRAAIAAIEATKPIVYYRVVDYVSPGKSIQIAAFSLWPEVWLFHPGDWPSIRDQVSPYCRLIDFREWRPSQEDIQKIPLEIEYHHESEPFTLRRSMLGHFI